MKLSKLNNELYKKAKLLFPENDTHSVKIKIEIGTVTRLKYSVLLMGFDVSDFNKKPNFANIQSSSIDSIFNDVNRLIEKRQKNEIIECE